MADIFSDYGIIFAYLPMIFVLGWCINMVVLPFSLIKQKRFPTIWDTLPFARSCGRGQAKAVATVLALLYLLFVSMDYSLVGFLDAILSGEEHWLISAATIIIFYNWFGCLVYNGDVSTSKK